MTKDNQQNKENIKAMFNDIANNYDRLNNILSLGLHKRWKRLATNKLNINKGDRVLDVCSGTADMAIMLAKEVGNEGGAIALDFSNEMLQIGMEKALRENVRNVIQFIRGDAEELPFDDDSFDGITIGFGIRNVPHRERAFSEMSRVLKKGKRLACLEFSHPTFTPAKLAYDFYSFRLIPKIGRVISNNYEAYSYLPASIRSFPNQEELKITIEKCGFKDVFYKNLSCGIVALHVGEKP
ncbi:MAG: bifunctional demethylmenaquinone methyltransferase/2-methoxy-6-polyprenyl-1,4-benzoquinol methylase UbiE [Actinomycetia bacterium]|nr:bifunctional demethylmenaquinone methyltransferase/2-methoxy-6-polyprenyl-1,4-benzoquinol methylase UbiE [Actinomycetes bacterium]